MGRKKTPPFPAYPAWTTAKFFGWVRAILRQGYTRWPPKFEALKKASRPKPAKNKGRHRIEYKCAQCKKWKTRATVEVDHIIPCGSLKSYEDIPGFAERLFVGVDGLQVICKPCHKKKTAADRKYNEVIMENDNGKQV
jgi:5-methylcytosine-specific restriction endonuclease McrA